MNTIVISRKTAGASGRESYVTRIRSRAGGRGVAAGLWLVLALAAAGLFSSSASAAEDESWQEPPRRPARTVAQSSPDEERPSRAVAPDDDTPRVTPRRHTRTVAQNYPDDELPSRTAAADDDTPRVTPRRHVRTVAQNYPEEVPSRAVAPEDTTPRLTPPVSNGKGDSSPKQPAAKKKAELAGEATPDDDPQPARKIHSAARRSTAADEESVAGGNEPFANADEECENDFGYNCPRFRELLSNRLWVRSEGLLWWTRGGHIPPLLTTSPANATIPPPSTTAALGQDTTQVLFGDQELNTGLQAGSRLSFGLWLDGCEESGLEFSYSFLAQNTQTYSANTATPILARPYYDVSSGTTNGPTSLLLAYPQWAVGPQFIASSTENFQTAEALWRRAIVHGCDGRIDLLLGYRFASLTDGLEIFSSSTTGPSNTLPLPGHTDTIAVRDTFHTRNDFNGGELGFATEWHRNRWSLETLLKMGIGSTHSQVFINGYTRVTDVVNATTTVTDHPGGFLAQASNYGFHDSQEFAVMPEIGFTLGYDLTPRLKVTAGYTLLYWSSVARPGDQIDLNIDSRQFPPPQGTGPFTKPELAMPMHTSDFWAQGLNLGLDYRF